MEGIIKREETWISEHIFAYGEELIVKGAFLPGALKKIGRVYFEVYEIYPTAESTLATIHTKVQAAAQKGDNPMISYTVSMMEAYYSLKDITLPSYCRSRLRLFLTKQDNDYVLQFVRFCCLSSLAVKGLYSVQYFIIFL